jgi:deoxyribodipyrimidine photo-lyase
MSSTSLVWFRNDLRVLDNPALHEARLRGRVVGVFLVADAQWREHHVAPARLKLLKRTLGELERSLEALGIPFWVERAPRFADAPDCLISVARRCGADRIYCNAEYPLNELRRDRAAYRACRASGIGFERRHGGVVIAPGAIATKEGTPYKVFTPFKRAWLEHLTPDDWSPLPAPDAQPVPDLKTPPMSRALACLPEGEPADWPGGEREANRRLIRFLDEKVERYDSDRDFPAREGTSRLSPYLSIGAISARRCLAEARLRNDRRLNARRGSNPGLDTWIDELIWREFYRHVVAAFPHVSRGESFRQELDALSWRDDSEQFDRWRQGETGYPLVDAGMRQLKRTGWMHNRLRMVTAMFLSKHLLLDWRLGERHFMETLVDGDFASNNGGWQWSASTGTDAAPYFRIFNPKSQAKKFDPSGEFVLEYVPELETGQGNATTSYPEPVVDHAQARQRALDFFARD